MKTHDFIFSPQLRYRASRHLVFWCIFSVYFFYVNFLPSIPSDLWTATSYKNAAQLMIYFPVSVLSVYVSIYFLLPQYILKERYLSLIMVTAFLIVIYFFFALLLTYLLARFTSTVSFSQLPVSFRWFQPVRYGIGLPITCGAITTIIKLAKSWHLKQRENELLQQQKIKTELQLLKTQFQPQFLYDALQNIYLLLQQNSVNSPNTLLQLSDLLSYVIYENDQEYVLLNKELEMVRNYINLKHEFYSEKFTTVFSQDLANDGLFIKPLLLVSFSEKSLEKFLSLFDRPLNLTITVKTENDMVYFQLECKSAFPKEKPVLSSYEWEPLLKGMRMQYEDRFNFDVLIQPDSIKLLVVLQLDKIDKLPERKKEKLVLP